MKSPTLLSLVSATLAISSLSSAVATTYNVLHRVSSFTSSPEWTVRGVLDLDHNTTVYTDVLPSEEVKALHERALAPKAGDLFYQIALSSEGKPQEQELWTSIRLCHLRQTHPDLPTIDDELTLTHRNQRVTGLQYRILDISLDAHSCPLPSTSKWNKVQEQKRKQRQRQLSRRSRSSSKSTTTPSNPPSPEAKFFSTKIHSTSPQIAAKPTLKQAAPTNQDGSIQVPPPEKTFVQKYWYYAIPVVLLLIMPDGQEEAGAEGHASSEHRGTGMGAKRLN
ncbi:uncharacterized protein SPSC_05272 [Sporisorium scitamineum]|uniref:ER membrane protein complex subunit 10 n=1 Tax=Sporisorium scitamineum TaxID=49012 RepID=A0A0F7RZX3_9BASI|nr:uncharacterized protein SPSC_05272 [Sporisorium scitamineum]CDS00594.1 hypothetical protein [Sporisorium scitamineum]